MKILVPLLIASVPVIYDNGQFWILLFCGFGLDNLVGLNEEDGGKMEYHFLSPKEDHEGLYLLYNQPGQFV